VVEVERVMQQLEEMTRRYTSLAEEVAGATESVQGKATQLIDQVSMFELDQ
jgi:methyl-accepting chemotaxis protein